MKLLELSIDSFQCVQRAQIKFGQALNILYGPNDLGKSTLAAAIRAALLVQSGSSEGDRFVPWYKDARPKAELTFSDHKEHIWRVSKSFGGGASAELMYSKDGRSFALECRARQVDEKLRTMLGWGIPPPAGRGGTRGVPTSILVNVLLAGQTDVVSVLEVGLEKDGDESGKSRLQKALSALAEHPLYKSVLAAAQVEFDKYFTERGNEKRGADSPFRQAAGAVNSYKQELDGLRAKLQESRDTEEKVGLLRDEEKAALAAREAAEEALMTARRGVENARARQEAEQRLHAAETRLKEVQAHEARIHALERERVQHTTDAGVKDMGVQSAKQACEAAAGALKSAEDAQRIASSDAAEQQRQLRAAELKTEAAQLDTQRSRSEGVRQIAKHAQEALNEVTRGEQSVAEMTEQLGVLEQARTNAASNQERLAGEAELTRALLAFGRWRVAVRAAEEVEIARRRGVELRTQIGEKEASAAQLQQECADRNAALAQRRSRLPEPGTLREIEALEREIAVAEAALGGGLSIALRPQREIEVQVMVDGVEGVKEPRLARELVLDAQRAVRLSIDDLAEIDVTAGTAEARTALTRARDRWEQDARPVLAKAEVQSVSELGTLLRSLASDERDAQGLQKRLEDAQRDIATLGAQVQLVEQQGARPVDDPDQLRERERAIGGVAHELLRPRLEKLGKTWEAAAEAANIKSQEQLTAAKDKLTASSSDLTLQRSRLADAHLQLEAKKQVAAVALQPLNDENPRTAISRLEGEMNRAALRSQEITRELTSLEAAAGAQRTEAERQVASAKQRCVDADDARSAAEQALERVRAEVNRVAGQLKAMNEQLAQMDKSQAVLRTQEAATVLAALPTTPLATEEDLANAQAALKDAEATLEEQREVVHKAEGALTKVGGAQLRERAHQASEALTAAQMREKELTLEASAWKLLRETLRESENSEGEHLGRALSVPVEEKLVELTRGRYNGLRFGPALCPKGLGASGTTGDAEVLDALSVGTRDQLATLIRLTIASQLKCAVILDDHLVHTDPNRILWFRDLLRRTAVDTQVIVFTCRPGDYLDADELPGEEPFRDIAGGTTRAIDLEKLITRFDVPALGTAPTQQHEPTARLEGV